jgi:hypothetical protein
MRTGVSGLLVLAAIAAPLFAIEPVSPNANVFIDSMNGFGSFLAAAFRVKSVPVQVVADRRQADFEIVGSSLHKDAQWADVLLSQGGSYARATVSMVNLKTGTVAFAYAYNAIYALHGAQSAAESCAKHLRGAIEKGVVNLRAAAVAPGHHAGETTAIPAGEPDTQAAIPPAKQLLPVAIVSDPAGARIEVEGTFAGVTPATIKLQPGEYQVTLSLAGHEGWSGTVIVQAGTPAAVAAAMRSLVTAAAVQ